LELVGDASQALLVAAQDIEAGRAPDTKRFPLIVAEANGLRRGLDAGRSASWSSAVPATADDVSPAVGEIVIGDVRISATLYQIYLREVGANMTTLDAELTRCECEPDHQVASILIRAVHTIKSSSRTTGFSTVADLADSMELCLQRFENQILPPAVLEAIWEARDALSAMLSDIGQQRAPQPAHAARNQLHDIAATNATPEQAGDAEQGREELDAHLAPVFLEEAGQLLPQIVADLKKWRNEPGEMQNARSLARALHTLKGSARMAGALRIGELTHRWLNRERNGS
jgi:chemosensory pili system protein ChpA (sensor histidine kinase/response regulator)